MPGSMSAHLGTRRPPLLALRRRIPPPLASLPRRSGLPGAVVAGARFVRSRHLVESEERPLGFVFILPRLKAR
jgi:hypothetical protein